MKKVLLTLLIPATAFTLSAQSQDWVDQMSDPTVNFYTVQQTFEDYWEGREVEKGKGWKQFKRWEAFWEPRVYPEGIRPNPNVFSQGVMQLEQIQANGNLGQWNPLGPYDGNALGGIGRVNRVRFHPDNHNIVFACTPAGGLWKSLDGGLNWTTNTDLLPNLGCSDIAFNPLNPDVMYLATGDRDGGDTYAYGILKSTDGGETWNPTGLSFASQFQVRASDVYVSPVDTSVIIAVTRAGIYRSTDAGANWNQMQSGTFNGLVQKVGNPNILFSTTINGSANKIFRSNDMGITWAQVTHPNLPSTNARRIELAVTPDDTNYIYALVGASNNGFEGIYRSTDGGVSWTLRASSPNLLGWSTTGSDNGGQAWYDLAIAVNPTNKDQVFVGGVNIWTSNNGGTSWSLAAHWYGGGGAPFVHADVHHLTFIPDSDTLLAGTDGGVYRDIPNKTTWDRLNVGMNITQYYRIGTSASDTSRLLAGAQDNGTHRLASANWGRVRGGDGMECAISSKDPNVMYSTVYYGAIRKSVNGGGNFNATFNLPPSGSGNWVTPFVLDPLHPDTIYAGFEQVWRSLNGGISFTAVSPVSMTGGRKLDQMAIAPVNTAIIYASEGNDLWKSVDYGANWTNLSTNVPGGSAISYIAVDYKNSDHVIITRSGYNSGQKVYESYDGGQNWTNISTGLPNLPVNCVTIENNDEHGVYIGTDVGVFYRDSVNPEWVSFNANLPNVIVNELEINYINRKLRAATYGRGLWESPLFSDLVPPVSKAEFPKTVCVGDTVILLDKSEYNPVKYTWYIEPSNYTYVNGSTDTTQNPQIVFNQKGIYNISLVTSNLLGEDSVYFVSAVAVGGLPLPYKSELEDPEDFDQWSFDETLNGWEMASTTHGNSFRASLFNNPNVGDRYELISPAIDLSQHDSASLSFNYAYSGATLNSDDSLIVYVAPSCGDTWFRLASYGENGTDNFRTTSPTSVSFDPSPGDWCNNALAACPDIDLKAYAGDEGLRIKFVAYNANGNNIYLDDIEVTGRPIAPPTAAFGSLTRVCAMDTITFVDQTYGSPNQWQWTFSGPVSFTSNDRNPELLFTTSGIYEVKLAVENSIGADSVIKTAYLTVDPADSVISQFQAANDTLCYGEDLTLNLNVFNEGQNPSFTWFINGLKVATSNTGTYTFKNLNDGDQIYAALQSDLSCAFPDIAYSDTVVAHVYPVITPQIAAPSLMCATDPPLTLTATPAGGTYNGNGVSNGVFDPSVAGNGSHEITYVVTDGNGCTYTAKKYIGVSNPISLSVSSNPTVCLSDGPTTFNVGSPLGGIYSGPGMFNNVFYPDSAGVGTHTLAYSYIQTTCGTTSINFTVTVLANPAKPGVQVYNNTLTCSANATSYQWYDKNGAVSGATGQSYSPTVDGKYVVRISDNNGCQSFSDSSSFHIGLKELPEGFEFKLFPNPAQGIVNLEIKTQEHYDLTLSIYSNVGSLIQSFKVNVTGPVSRPIDLSQYASGVYMIGLEGENVSIKQKIILQ